MDLQRALQELADTVKEIVELRIRRYGVNPRTGTNTLQGSDLEKSINVSPTADGIALPHFSSVCEKPYRMGEKEKY